MDKNFKERKLYAKWLFGIISLSILFYLAVSNLNVLGNTLAWVINIVFPLILGLIFALILNLPMRFFEKHFWPGAKKKFANKIRRPLALLLAIILIIGVITGIVMLIIPQLAEAIRIIVNSITQTVNDLSTLDKKAFRDSAVLSFILKLDWASILNKFEHSFADAGTNIMNNAFSTVGSIFGGIVDFFVAVVLSVYILLSKEKLKAQTCRIIKVWFPEKIGEIIKHVSATASAAFGNFVSGQTIEALILGILCTLGMLLLRIPYAPTIGALVGVTALVPVVGAFIGGGVGAFMIVAESPLKALIFLIFLIVLQQIEGNLIYPKMMGNRINLPAIWVLAAVTVGGALYGAVGMLFAVPLMSTLYTLIREETEKRELKSINKTEELTEVVKNDEVQ